MFVRPTGAHASTIRVKWSPQVTYIDCVENIHEFKNARIPVLSRVGTYEGLQKDIREVVILAGSKRKEIENTCGNIVNHLNSMSNGCFKVNNIELFFRVGDDSKLWLLFCTDLKLKELIVKPIKHIRASSLDSVYGKRRTAEYKR